MDENGKTRDISLKLKETENGDLVTADNNVITTFSKELSGGIDLEYEDISVRLVPEMADGQNISVVLSEDSKTAVYTLDEQTSLSYALTCTGFKEDIVVSEYTGQTDYEFTLFTSGLELWEQDGSYYLRDEAGEVKANIGDVIMFTADEKNNTMGSMSAETVSENEEYRLTIHVDDEYLASPETVYPIRIDPTIEYNYDNYGLSSIDDATISESNPSVDYGSLSSLVVGKHYTCGISRALIRFPMDIFSSYSSSQNIQSATLNIYDILHPGTSVQVACYMFEGSIWNGSTVNWNNADSEHFNSVVSSKAISYNNGLNQTIQHRYEYNITKAVKKWVDGSFNQNTGLIFKAKDSVENGDDIKYVVFGSMNGSTNRPSLTINYTTYVLRNHYYSKYDPSKYNTYYPYPPGYNTKDIEYRMNCYGYAFCNISNEDVTINDILDGYKQQPGEFVEPESRSQVILTHYKTNAPEKMEALVSDLQLDATRFGYSLSLYTPSSSTVEQYGDDSRLIAVVTSNSNFHFYMQHNDGSWSHKPGSEPVTNVSLDDSVGTLSKILTNENILDEANKGEYEVPANYTKNQCLKFFVITKYAAIDQPHSERCCMNWNSCQDYHPVTIYPNDKAGDYYETSTDIFSGLLNTKSVQMSFTKDVDYYYFADHGSGNYRITATITSNGNFYSDLQCKIYNANRTYTGYCDLGSGDVDLTFPCSGGTQYYIMIYDKNRTYSDAYRQQLYNYSIKIEEVD